MFKTVIAGLAVMASFAVADRAFALGGTGDTSASYNVTVAGIRAGRMDLSSSVNGTSYAASMNLRSTGLLAALAKYKFKASSRGTLSGAQGFRPSKYTENSDTGKRTNNVSITYSSGVPKPSKTAPAPALKGSTQKGTVDPMAAIFAVFRDRAKGDLCKTNLKIYDGKRRTGIRLSPGKITSKSATCNGTFKRLGGFTASKMQEGSSFPLTINYTFTNGVYQVKSVTVKSARGRATFSRR